MNTLDISQKIDFHFQGNHSILQPQDGQKVIGLSGASGFLGLHILDELVSNPNIVKIKCFIRNKSKFNEKKKEFNLQFNEDKLEFYTDIKEEDLIDVSNFIHSAAQLHSLKNADQLWEDNVILTQDILTKLKGKIHYISTLSVFASSDKQGKHLQQLILPDLDYSLHGGYAQTKWASEYIVSHYNDYQIFRLGLLTPSKQHPYFQAHEFSYIFISLLNELKIHPKGYEEAYVDISPVDSVAKIICESIDSEKKVIHIANETATSLSSILKQVNTNEVSKEEWIKSISHLKKTYQILLHYAFFKKEALQLYPNYYNIDLFQTTGQDWEGQITDNLMDTYIGNILCTKTV